MKIIGCIPNFSEGRKQSFLVEIAKSSASSTGALLLDSSRDVDHNRSVFTIMGVPTDVKQATLRGCLQAVKMIDMSKHQGAHPRIGSVDVVPFVPLAEATLSDAVALARAFGEEFSRTSEVPVYYYGAAANVPERQELSVLRRGGYESLFERMSLPEWQPDVGKAVFNEVSGATIVGARMPLVAFNVNLDSADWCLAKQIASRIRESNGGLPAVRALGVFLQSRAIAQVSTNITDLRRSNMKTVFDFVSLLVRQAGVRIRETELIGLAPLAAWGGAMPEDILLANFSPTMIWEQRVEDFVNSFKGSDL